MLHSASTVADSQPEEVGGASSAPNNSAPQLADGHSQEQQEVINLAWEVSKGDMRFIYLLTAENGEFTYRRIHNPINNSVGVDHGLCGVNDYYHSAIVENQRFFTDIRWQMQQCYDLYTGGTRFWGITRYDNNASYRQQIHSKFK